jgi:nucleotide-binding universal stress UspA family protein
MRRHSATKPIVVGIDGSPDGLRALQYAVGAAQENQCGIRLVHAYHISAMLNPMMPLYGIESLRESGVVALNEAEQKAHELDPGLHVELHVASTSPSMALVEESKTASMVVVGRRTIHGLPRFLSGSTSTAVAAHAKCPVVSVPAAWSGDDDDSRIVVGVDGSDAGRDALAYAFRLASARHCSLIALRAWERPSRWYTDVPELTGEESEWAERIQLSLAEDLAGWSEQYPDVQVVRVFERLTSPAEAIGRRAEDASLVVIGSRGLGGLPGLDLGWTARSVLAHASCPVIVVHQGDQLIEENLLSPAIPAMSSE